MKRSIRHFLDDALEYCEKTQKFVADISYEEFRNDDKTFLAVTRALEIIGEALKNIPDEIKTKFPQVPWREIIGFRNTVAHVYFGVDPKIVWNTAKEDVKYLGQLIKVIIKDTE
jgi:uncharacterized protein with HEPN domain